MKKHFNFEITFIFSIIFPLYIELKVLIVLLMLCYTMTFIVLLNCVRLTVDNGLNPLEGDIILVVVKKKKRT